MSAVTDRSDLLEKASALVRRGDFKNALPLYARLFQQDPSDWTIANTLGDLYVRAGRSDDAATHFATLAEKLAEDGFIVKARGLYRKILRLQPDNVVAKRRVDELDEYGTAANPFLQRVMETARAARAASGTPEPASPAPPTPTGDAAAASARTSEPAAAWTTGSLAAEPAPPIVSAPALPNVSAAPPPLVSVPAPPFPSVPAPPIVSAPAPPLVSVSPPVAEPAPAVVPHASDPWVAHEPVVIDDFTLVAQAADAAVRRADFTRATTVIEEFLTRQPAHVEALEKLIEVAVDGRRETELWWAQVRLAEACLQAGRYQQAQDIALDLIARQPGTPRYEALLDRVSTEAGEHRQALRPVVVFDGRLEDEVAAPVELSPSPRDVVPAEIAAAPQRTRVSDPPPVVAVPPPSVREAAAPATPPSSLSDFRIQSAAARGADLPPELNEWSDPEEAFDELRTGLIEEAAAAAEERFSESAHLIEVGRVDQAIRALEEAMCAPHLRASAGARLASLYRDVGAPAEALECLEWVAEMPPANEESGYELAYELAVTLEVLGQQEQALGVYRELVAEVGSDYRDVAARARRLAAA